VAHHPEDRTVPGVTVLRVEAGLFFAKADHVHAAIQNAVTNGAQAVVPDCETMPTIDVTAARMLSQLAADLQRPGMRLVLAGQFGQVRDMVAAVGGPDGTPEIIARRHATQKGEIEMADR
jgi:sulfate permease, SulP family